MKIHIMQLAALTLLGGVVSAEVNVGPAMPITHRVTINPIQTRNTGGQAATVLGNTVVSDYIKEQINRVWAQAGVEIEWLPVKNWVNNFAYDDNGASYLGDRNRRPTSHLSVINNDSSAPSVSRADFINMFFVETVPGFNSGLSSNVAAGLAFVDGSGTTVYVGSGLLGFEGGRDVIATVLAHEIGHNLALSHVFGSGNTARLMFSGQRPFSDSGSGFVVQSETDEVFTDDSGLDGFELLKAIPQMTNYEQWVDNNSLLQGPLGDDDGDGVLNLTEFALGMNPGINDPSTFPQPTLVSNGLTWQISKQPEAVADGINYNIQVSNDLSSFVDAGSSGSGSLVEVDSSSLLRVRLSGGNRSFATLNISMPSQTRSLVVRGNSVEGAGVAREPRISNCGVDGCGFHMLMPK